MSFVIPATPGVAAPAADCPPPLPQAGGQAEPAIANDGFFPDVAPHALRAQVRVRDHVTPARWREALLGAIITVGNDLAAWADRQQAAGHATLAAVPGPSIGGEPRLLILYRRAVALNAKAEIVERTPDIDTTGAGQRKAEDLEPTIGDLRRDALHAVRDMLGVGRLDVELI